VIVGAPTHGPCRTRAIVPVRLCDDAKECELWGAELARKPVEFVSVEVRSNRRRVAVQQLWRGNQLRDQPWKWIAGVHLRDLSDLSYTREMSRYVACLHAP
jgi:hypothetical protein